MWPNNINYVKRTEKEYSLWQSYASLSSLSLSSMVRWSRNARSCTLQPFSFVQYCPVLHCSVPYLQVSTIVLLLRSELHSGICRWRLLMPWVTLLRLGPAAWGDAVCQYQQVIGRGTDGYQVTGIHLAAVTYTHCVSRKRPTFTTCYNFYTHSSIATIFGTNVAEKVGN